MTSLIAIDFGTTRTKIAYAKTDGRLELMEFREGRRYIPSLFHLEADNDTVLWGDDAEDMLIDDPLGVVTVLKRRLRQKKIRANGRSVSPHDMLVVMFSRLRGEAGVRVPVFLGEPPSALTLTLPALYGQVEEDLMRAAATTAGFERVEIMAEPVAAARAWLGETSEYANDVVVFDCGGGTVDWAYLAERDGSLRLMPQCPPGGSNEIGGHDVDEAILDRLKQRVANNDKAMRELDERRPYYLGRLRALKEDVSRGLNARPLKIADARVEFSTDEMMAVAQDRFIGKACAGLKEYLEKVSTVASQIPPVLLVGGGSELRGLADEVSALGCRVVRWDRAEFAPVLGAALGGDGPELDLQAADVTTLICLANDGNVDAQYELGERHVRGRDAPRDPNEGARWLKMAAEHGHIDGKASLGELYLDDKRFSGKADLAMKFLAEAADAGNVVAQARLGECLNSGVGLVRNRKEAVRYLRLAAEQGKIESQALLGCILSAEDSGTKNTKEALRWLTISAERGHAKAQSRLGAIYRCGDGVAADPKAAVRLLTHASDAGEADAHFHIGEMHLEGRHMARLPDEAVKHFQCAAKQGHIPAQLALSAIYDRGDGVPPSREKTAEWLRKAAEQGEKDAQFRLGKMYQLGDGVTRNQSTALEWFGRAAKQGHTDAKRELAYEKFQVDIVSVLKPLADNKSLFVRPDIPENKLNNARRKFDVPAHEDALGLLDSTVWGFSGKGILFGKFGIYCRDNNKVQHVPYSDFLGHSFKTGWVSDTVKLPGNRKFVISSSSVSKKIIADSLNKITAKINAKGVFYK